MGCGCKKSKEVTLEEKKEKTFDKTSTVQSPSSQKITEDKDLKEKIIEKLKKLK